MVRSLIVAVMLCAATSLAADRAAAPAKIPAGWQEAVSKEGGYALAFPGTPEESDLRTESGEFLARMFVLEVGESAYMASYSEVDPERLKVGSARLLLDARDGAVANVSGTVTSEKKIKLGAHPGLDLVISVPAQTTAEGVREAMTTFLRVYLANGRIYQAMVIVPQRNAASMTKDVQTYLGSFRFTKR